MIISSRNTKANCCIIADNITSIVCGNVVGVVHKKMAFVKIEPARDAKQEMFGPDLCHPFRPSDTIISIKREENQCLA